MTFNVNVLPSGIDSCTKFEDPVLPVEPTPYTRLWIQIQDETGIGFAIDATILQVQEDRVTFLDYLGRGIYCYPRSTLTCYPQSK